MKLVETLLSDWQRWTCSHRWVRARWDDGSYGLRCSLCMKPYRHTWDEIIGAPAAAARRGLAPQPASACTLECEPAPATVAEFPALRRAA
ncbi:MAG TPA: hypothetical protein VN515_02485 [Terriglobales bacterium]|nr:hypothetical protein [Terriglobales bacterium]